MLYNHDSILSPIHTLQNIYYSNIVLKIHQSYQQQKHKNNIFTV